MTKNMLPEDVIMHILEYNPEHRVQFRISLKIIPKYKLLKQIHVNITHKNFEKILNKFDEQIETNSNWDLQSLVKTNIDNPDNWIRGFHKCTCCTRHQRKKPKHINDHDYMRTTCIPITLISTSRSSLCKCNCRWASRFIYNSVHNNLTKDDRYSKLWATDPVFS